jgi:hypothetical protein
MQPICCHDFELINLQNESDLFSLLDWKESHYQRARQWRSSGYVSLARTKTKSEWETEFHRRTTDIFRRTVDSYQ